MENVPSPTVQVVALMTNLAKDALHQAEWAAIVRSTPNATVEEIEASKKRGHSKAINLVADIGKPFLPISLDNLDAFGVALTVAILHQANLILPVID